MERKVPTDFAIVIRLSATLRFASCGWIFFHKLQRATSCAYIGASSRVCEYIHYHNTHTSHTHLCACQRERREIYTQCIYRESTPLTSERALTHTHEHKHERESRSVSGVRESHAHSQPVRIVGRRTDE